MMIMGNVEIPVAVQKRWFDRVLGYLVAFGLGAGSAFIMYDIPGLWGAAAAFDQTRIVIPQLQQQLAATQMALFDIKPAAGSVQQNCPDKGE